MQIFEIVREVHSRDPDVKAITEEHEYVRGDSLLHVLTIAIADDEGLEDIHEIKCVREVLSGVRNLPELPEHKSA